MEHQTDDVADVLKDVDLYFAAKTGTVVDFRRALNRVSAADRASSEQILERVTPAQNTLAHVAAKHGNKVIVHHIVANFPHLVLEKNLNGDTVLHIASKAGDLSMIKALLPRLVEGNKLVRERNLRGNTALHEALLSGREVVAQYLIQQDSEMLYYQNHQGDYALYLAAEAGFAACVSSILQLCADQERINQQFIEKSPIQAAILKKKKDVLKAIMNWNPRFIKLKDGKGRTPLHYAASSGYLQGVRHLLQRYAASTAERDKSGSCPIHLASVNGHLEIIKLLLPYCPAPAELLDSCGCNLLHLAASNGHGSIVKYIMNNANLEELMSMQDLEGNSPLHLAAMGWYPRIVNALIWDKRVDINLVNYNGMTAFDAVLFSLKENPPFHQRLTWIVLSAAGASHSLPGRNYINVCFTAEFVKERVNTLVLVSTLVTTITFAASFTMPGGYDSSSLDPGMATMLREMGLHVFVLCDSIAMHCSMIAAVALIFAQFADINLVITAVSFIALPLLGIALSMMSIAFTAGLFVVVSKLRWLSVCVVVIGCSFLSMLLFLLLLVAIPYHLNNRLVRYLSYYPLCLLILAATNPWLTQSIL